MKDHLQDIVQHTHGLGVIDLVKITGTEQETTLEAIDQVNRTVIVKAKFNGIVSDFIGTFGMPNLGKLNTILNIPEYKEDAKITVTQKTNAAGTNEPDGIHFENKAGDFKNDYRLMGSGIVEAQLKTSRMVKEIKWSVEFQPSAVSIQRLKFQASANSEETNFVAKTENGNLKFFFGDHSSHAGDFVFHAGVKGTLNKAYRWPVSVVISILSLPGDKTFKISGDDGLIEIAVNSGIAEYRYLLPAQTK
jgi:hypothetical protein